MHENNAFAQLRLFQPAVNHNLMTISLFFSNFHLSRTRKTDTHKTIKPSYFCGRDYQFRGVCVYVCVCEISKDTHCQPCLFCLCLSDRYMRVDERTPPAENYLVQRWPAATWSQRQEREYGTFSVWRVISDVVHREGRVGKGNSCPTLAAFSWIIYLKKSIKKKSEKETEVKFLIHFN